MERTNYLTYNTPDLVFKQKTISSRQKKGLWVYSPTWFSAACRASSHIVIQSSTCYYEPSCQTWQDGRVSAPHYRNTQFRKWSYLGAGCWLRTFLSLFWLHISVVRAGLGGLIILPPEIHFLLLAMSRSTKRLLPTPPASIFAHWPHLGRTNTPLHTDGHTPPAQLHASIADSSTMSSIWFSFTPENPNNPRRRWSWQLSIIHRTAGCERMSPQKWVISHYGYSWRVRRITFFTPPTPTVALVQTSPHLLKQHTVSISGQTYTISGDEERGGKGLLVFRGETPQKRICNSAAGGCNYSETLQQDKERK